MQKRRGIIFADCSSALKEQRVDMVSLRLLLLVVSKTFGLAPKFLQLFPVPMRIDLRSFEFQERTDDKPPF
jgi:hypothetical protein